MSRLRIVLQAGEVQRRLTNSKTYAALLFDLRLSPLLQDMPACYDYIDDVNANASPDDTLQHIIGLNTRARRDALRHAALAGGRPWFVSSGLKFVVSELRQSSNSLLLARPPS
jgi:hypothetical protein